MLSKPSGAGLCSELAWNTWFSSRPAWPLTPQVLIQVVEFSHTLVRNRDRMPGVPRPRETVLLPASAHATGDQAAEGKGGMAECLRRTFFLPSLTEPSSAVEMEHTGTCF